MKSKLLHEATGARTFALVLDERDEVVASRGDALTDRPVRRNANATRARLLRHASAVIYGCVQESCVQRVVVTCA
jgi:hypothetical protein